MTWASCLFPLPCLALSPEDGGQFCHVLSRHDVYDGGLLVPTAPDQSNDCREFRKRVPWHRQCSSEPPGAQEEGV